MPSKFGRPCTSCGQRAVRSGKCQRHLNQHYKRMDLKRGNSTERGYGTEHKNRFRRGVLDRDNYTCGVCGGYGNVADHYPLSRKELIAAGMDPDDPANGRTLCKIHHDQHTGRTQGAGNLPREQ